MKSSYAINTGFTLDLKTDVLVIGGGPAAVWSAWSAAAQGAKVVLVDKGYVGTSGAAAASGNGVMVARPGSEEFHTLAEERYSAGKHLAQRRWIERVLEQTWRSMPLVEEWGYRFPIENGKPVRESYYGPEYLRVARKALLRAGVKLLDQSPALELLVDSSGVVAGARGVQRQENRTYTVKANAVVIATGGCAFLSKVLGCNTNTGDGLLMAAEIGGELSGMEFSGHYAISSALNATVTRGVPYAWATYTDEAGNDLGGIVNGRRAPSFLQTALLKGPVYARLDRATPEVKAIIERSHFIAFLPLLKAGIDPYTERFPVTLVLEGTVRGVGGIRVVDNQCGTSVPGLFVAGDAASREFLAGASSGGGGPNAAWAISSGNWAGAGAADFAAKIGPRGPERDVQPAGMAGLSASAAVRDTFDSDEVIRAVQGEVLPLQKNYFRSEQGLLDSLGVLESLWKQVRGSPRQDTLRQVERSRTAAALVATARWSYFAGLQRKETRGIQIRTDYPDTDPAQRHYLTTGGLDKLWIRPAPVPDSVEASSAAKETAVAP